MGMATVPVFVSVMVDNRLSLITGIEHEGEPLAVLQWIGNPSIGQRKPVYVLPIKSVRHQFYDDPAAPFRYMINDPLPKSLFDGSATRQVRKRYGVRKAPDVSLPMEPKRQQ